MLLHKALQIAHESLKSWVHQWIARWRVRVWILAGHASHGVRHTHLLCASTSHVLNSHGLLLLRQAHLIHAVRLFLVMLLPLNLLLLPG